MNMIGRSAHGDRDSIDGLQTSAKEGMEPGSPFRGNRRLIVFGVKHDVEIEAQVCLGHCRLWGRHTCGVRTVYGALPDALRRAKFRRAFGTKFLSNVAFTVIPGNMHPR